MQFFYPPPTEFSIFVVRVREHTFSNTHYTHTHTDIQSASSEKIALTLRSESESERNLVVPVDRDHRLQNVLRAVSCHPPTHAT